MEMYLLKGEIPAQWTEEAITYIYGVFDSRPLAEEHRKKLQKVLDNDGASEQLFIDELELNTPTETCFMAMEE